MSSNWCLTVWVCHASFRRKICSGNCVNSFLYYGKIHELNTTSDEYAAVYRKFIELSEVTKK